MVLSYAPIFFVIISSLIFVFFTTLNNSSQNKYIETNKAILQQMVQYTDSSLQLIERNVVSEFYENEELQFFFLDEPKTPWDYYLIQKSLIEFSSSLPFANSIYLYNDENKEILTSAKLISEENFADMSFFLPAYKEQGIDSWGNLREYRQSTLDKPVQVVSILKYYPYPSDKKGAIVVNVNVESIMDVLNRLNNNAQGSIAIVDNNNQAYQNATGSISTNPVYAVSDYTKWKFYANTVHADQFSILTLLSDIWILCGFIIILLSIAWFTIITHINYKPIQTIMGKIGEYTARKSEGLGIKSPRNELKLIEGAIDHLLEKTVDYDHLHNEGMLLRQRNLFNDLLTGYRTLNDADWERQMVSFGLPHHYEQLGVVVLEIDRYPEFMEHYNPSDQYLLKYIVETSFSELAEQRGLVIWHAWVHPNQLAVVIHLLNTHEPYANSLRKLCEDYHTWINENLELTLSIGIGQHVDSISSIADSYRHASSNVSFKTVFGTSSIIDHQLTSGRAGFEKFNWYQPLLELAHLYRLDDEQWVGKLDHIFSGLGQMLLSQVDIANFMNNLVHHLQKEIQTLSPDIQALWRNEYLDRFYQIANAAETLDECHKQVLTTMIKLAKEMENERISRTNHSIAVKIKGYIDRHYSDPNLSLNQVSDLFSVNPKSISNLFKEELGDKFIDYLLKVRFDHAKRMLVETDEPIQSIAEKVGYTHVISFHRAFKKLFDLPPGEYRNLYRNNRE